jgi:hypothetical protein
LLDVEALKQEVVEALGNYYDVSNLIVEVTV